MSEETQETVMKEEKEQEEALVSIAAEYVDLDVERDKRQLKIRIRRPKMADRNQAVRLGKAQFLSCMKEGIPTRSQAIKAAREAGLWTDEMETRMNEISAKINSLIEDQGATDNKATKAKITQKIRELKKQQLDIASTFTEITRNCIEAVQDDAEQSYLLVKTVFAVENDKEIPLYKSVDEMNQETDNSFIEKITNAASSFWMGDMLTSFLMLGELQDSQQPEQGTE